MLIISFIRFESYQNEFENKISFLKSVEES